MRRELDNFFFIHAIQTTLEEEKNETQFLPKDFICLFLILALIHNVLTQNIHFFFSFTAICIAYQAYSLISF